MSSRLTPEFMGQLADALSGTFNENLGEGVGFILVAVDHDGSDNTDFQFTSNIDDMGTIKKLLTEVVTYEETKN